MLKLNIEHALLKMLKMAPDCTCITIYKDRQRIRLTCNTMIWELVIPIDMIVEGEGNAETQ